jgi:uncharacterized protein
MAQTANLHDLINRIGSDHVERRLEIETQHEAQLFGQGLVLFNIENWKPAPWLVKSALKLSGLYARARRNADHVVVRRNKLNFAELPPAFDGFTILHLTDLHADISVGAMRHLISIVGNLEYDVCVLTGDYRGKTYGPFEKSLEIINELRQHSYGSFAGSNGNPDDVQRVRANCSPRSTHFLSRRRRPSFLSSRRH